MALTEKTLIWMKNNNIGRFEGKTVLITGANTGIGYKSAEIMVSLGARIIMACRNIQKAENAREELLREYPKAEIKVMLLDMADISSIDAFTDEIISNKIDIDVFVNNAGVFHKPNQQTQDGFELVMGTNYIGVFYLTKRIIRYLSKLSHEVYYINTISIIHKIASIDYDDFYYSRSYGNFSIYARSKLSVARFTYALAQRYKGTNVHVYMCHPGISITQMGMEAYGKFVGELADSLGFFFNSPEKSALALPYILSRNLEEGSIIGPNHMLGGWGYPEKNQTLKKVKVGSRKLIRFTNSEIKSRNSL